jgi:HEAT repeat protein
MKRRAFPFLLLGLLAGACTPRDEPLLPCPPEAAAFPPAPDGDRGEGTADAEEDPPGGSETETGEPSFEELAAALSSVDAEERAEARKGLVSLGPEAVPALCRLLERRPRVDSLNREVLEVLIDIGPGASPALVKIARQPPGFREYGVRTVATAALMRIRPLAPGTVSGLFRCLSSSRPFGHGDDPALLLAQEFGAEAVPQLVEILSSGHSWDQESALRCLAGIGDPAVPFLLTAAAGEGAERSASLRALQAVGPRAGWIPVFERGLSDPDPAARQACETALVSLGKPAVPALRRALEGPSEEARPHAMTALALLDEDLAPVLERMLSRWPDETRAGLLRRFHRLGSDAAKLAPVLGRLLGDRSEPVAEGAWEALSGMGAAAVPAFVEALRAPDLKLRAAAELGKLGKEPKRAVPALSELLLDADARVRRTALEALGEFFEDAAPAVPWLAMLVMDPRDPELRVEAARVLGRIGAEAYPALPALEALAREGGSKPLVELALVSIRGDKSSFR